MLPVEGPAAVDTRESCRQVHQVKGSVSGDVISNSLIQQEILEMSRNLEISRNGFEILQKFTNDLADSVNSVSEFWLV